MRWIFHCSRLPVSALTVWVNSCNSFLVRGDGAFGSWTYNSVELCL